MDKLDGLWVDIRETLSDRRNYARTRDLIENGEHFKLRMLNLLGNWGMPDQCPDRRDDLKATRQKLIEMAALVIQAIEDFNVVRPI